MHAVLLFLGVERPGANCPSDMVKVLCVDIDGVIQAATMARLPYRKWTEDVLAARQTRGTYIAMVDITITNRGFSHCIPVVITADEFMVMGKIIDLIVNRTESIPKDGKIPDEMRWAPSRIINSAIQYAETQKENITNAEAKILATNTADTFRNYERMGIPTKGTVQPGIFQCPDCNHQINLWQRFCTNCGKLLWI
jgi:hypothetical protein